MGDALLTLPDICARYQVSDRRARDIVRLHAVPVLRPGRVWLFDNRAETAFRVAITPGFHHEAEEILKRSLKARVSAVYFLIKEKEIVYVGKAVHVFRRLTQHLGKIEYDRFHFICCDENDLFRMEALYIAKFRPRLNKMPGHACHDD